ncbi:cilia- and flagella-associated protein 251 [Hydra vulgaris]|uniref:Cilia- and flagella-associated protein 251 n=1 Tax=Hydra vulgaris TaxID=6087 RepID=A0ABM4CPU3_HYDVU
MDLMDSTIKNLNDRTNSIYESIEAIDKKHCRLEKDFLKNIGVIKELREKAQELLSRQKQLEKSFKFLESDSYPASYIPTTKNNLEAYNDDYSAKKSVSKQTLVREPVNDRIQSTQKNRHFSDDDNSEDESKAIHTSSKVTFSNNEDEKTQENKNVEKGKARDHSIDEDDEYTIKEEKRSLDLSEEPNQDEEPELNEEEGLSKPENLDGNYNSEDERLREEEEEERIWEEEQRRKEEERRLRKLQEENDLDDEYAPREEEYLDEDRDEDIREKIESLKDEEYDLMQQEE